MFLWGWDGIFASGNRAGSWISILTRPQIDQPAKTPSWQKSGQKLDEPFVRVAVPSFKKLIATALHPVRFCQEKTLLDYVSIMRLRSESYCDHLR